MDIPTFKYIVFLLVLNVLSAEECPKKCTCKRSLQGNGPDWVKIRCGDAEKIDNLEELDLLNIANEVVQLNLSGNYLNMFSLKIQLIALQKLDISKNQISVLQNNQFIEVPNLRRLDLSGNVIKSIDIHTFSQLKQLERLKLNGNQISTIIKGTFKPLLGLKQLDISSNPLTCDCELLWLLDWTDKSSVKLMSNPKCATPLTFRGIPVKKLRIGDEIHCKSPAGNRDMPIVEISPGNSQVVFEGDSLKLHCRAPSVSSDFDYPPKDKIQWLWLDSNPKHFFTDIVIENRYLDNKGLIDSTLTIEKLSRNHTGIWNCQLISNERNHSKGITVMVISDETKYCPITSTTDNKGTYVWPRTVVNYTVSMPCESIQLSDDVIQQRASYFCSLSGEWDLLNTSRCSYISETTKILEQFSKVNLNLTKDSILESAKHFKNYTADVKILRDVMDLVYTVRTIEKYVNFVPVEKELAIILIDVCSKLLELPSLYFEEANLKDNSCDKLTKALEKVTSFIPSPFLHKHNLAMEVFPVKQEAFAGMTCTWYVSPTDQADRMFYCVTSNNSGVYGNKEKLIEASIQIPATLFLQLQKQGMKLKKGSPKILISMFGNGKLFPTGKGNTTVSSAVVGLKLDDLIVKNLTEPIYIMLRSSPVTTPEEPLPNPVWWNNETGNWTTEGCHFINELHGNTVFHCNRLGYYGLQQLKMQTQHIVIGEKFKFLHPAVYIGSFILFMCFLLSVLTYVLCYTTIQMPKKTKHSLMNIWIAILFLCFFYIFGIHQTEDVQVCQAVGLLLHYFTISSLLWMCVGMNSVYKRLHKSDIIELQDDELPSDDQPVRKPILGLYFVGWGVALIICGISGAVNLKEYSTKTHCFLNSEPALSALYIPCIMLLLILGVLFLLIRCAIYNSDSSGHLSEGTQATENVDLDLLEPSFPTSEMRSVRSVSTKTSTSENDDSEHTPMVQLKAYVIFLMMYIATWLSCAAATVQPVKFKHYEAVFCVSYAILSAVLGMFNLFFYCIARNDVRTQWVRLARCMRHTNLCCRSRIACNTSRTVPQIQIQPLPPIPTGPGIDIVSRSSSRSSHTKTNSHSSNMLKGAVDLNGSGYHEPHSLKANNVNLIVLHRQQYRNVNIVPNIIENPTSTAEMFYNPHQSTVARKFFRKQKKRNMMKHNNISRVQRNDVSDNASSIVGYPKRKMDNSNVDQSMFYTNSKVNNTNIHVEKVHRMRQRNPNIFLESYEEIGGEANDFDVKYKDRSRKRDVNKSRNKKKHNVPNIKSPSTHDNNMRSVSQQCTLEYSSEPISDSILDQKSPIRCVPIEEGFDSHDVMRVKCKESGVDEASGNFKNDSLYYNQNYTCKQRRKFLKGDRPARMLHTLYEPSDVSLAVNDSTSECCDKNITRVFVNPSHDLLSRRVQSRASSVSASELDELYQEIRRGPRLKHTHSQRYVNDRSIRQPSPYFSDSEIMSCVSEVRCRYRTFFKNNRKDGNNESKV